MKDQEIRLRFARQQVARLIRQRRTVLRGDVWRTDGKRSELQGELRGLQLRTAFHIMASLWNSKLEIWFS
jgi:hypothetical protein